MNTLGAKEGMDPLDFSTEFSGKELVLIQKIKLGSIEKDPELRAAYIQWVDTNQAECQKDETEQANVNFLMKKAKLFIMAGQLGEAWTDLFDIRTLAENIGRHDLVEEANALLLEIAEKP